MLPPVAVLLFALAATTPATQAAYKPDMTPRAKEHIKNVVVLIMENRSFDSFLGRLKWDGINPSVNGLTGDEFNIVDGKKVLVSKVSQPAAGFDPSHQVDHVTQQIYGTGVINAAGKTPTMAGFGQDGFQFSGNSQNAVTQVMGAFGPDTLPVTYALAQEFSIIQDWFASVPGPTYPNRHFAHCATAVGLTDNSNLLSGVGCRSIFENLDDNGKSWNIYASTIKLSTLMYKSMRWPNKLLHIRSIDRFITDAKAGKLPQYSYIDPDFDKNDNHPPNDIREGERFVKKLYEAVRASPQWNQTLFLITYDENGGFYDHVPPPTGVPILDDSPVSPAVGDFKFDRLGPRVPAILISPLVPKGGVFQSTVPGRNYEHSSIPATLKNIFNLPSFLTRRDAWALPFDNIASLPSPRTECPVTLPSI
nr:hypothetical protein HK105_002012 [Polyrhizophydium stewartii]